MAQKIKKTLKRKNKKILTFKPLLKEIRLKNLAIKKIF